MNIEQAVAKARLEVMKAVDKYEQRTMCELIEAGSTIEDAQRNVDRNRPEMLSNIDRKLDEIRAWIKRDWQTIQ